MTYSLKNCVGVQTQEFWASAGFVGGWADEPMDSEEDEDEEKNDGTEPVHQTISSGFDDSEPVFEIREPADGSMGSLTKHDSQTAFEKSGSYPY
jgi:hypothetical protein